MPALSEALCQETRAQPVRALKNTKIIRTFFFMATWLGHRVEGPTDRPRYNVLLVYQAIRVVGVEKDRRGAHYLISFSY